jgi:hypothetical protein
LVTHPGLLGLTAPRVPAADASFARAADLVLIAVLWVAAAGLLRRRGAHDRPVAFTAAFASAMLFPLPLVVATSPYRAIGGLTLAHGLQYLTLVGQTVVGPAPRRSPARLVFIAAAALLGAGVLSSMSHLHGDPGVARVGYGAYLGLVMAHFVVDGGLWRLRDAWARRLLTARLPGLLTSDREATNTRLPVYRHPVEVR